MTQKRIVIADDDPLLIHAIQKRCEGLGLSVQTATNGVAAMTLIRWEKPDLVILDVNMPGLDGLELARILATGQGLGRIPVILLTGRTDELVKQSCRDFSVHYVPKSPDAWRRMRKIVCRLFDLEPDAWNAVDHAARRIPFELLTAQSAEAVFHN